MTIQTTNIDVTFGGDAVDLTDLDETLFIVADNVFIENQLGTGIAVDGSNIVIENNGGIVAIGDGVELDEGVDHFYNEPTGNVFGSVGVQMTTAGEIFVNYGDVSGNVFGVDDTGGAT